jgi:hypothetical protein
VTLSGGFLLCEYVPGIENYFTIDKEIVCFKNAIEAVEKIKYYLDRELERNAIATAGYERAIKNYSGKIIVNKIFSEILTREQSPAEKNALPASPQPNNLTRLYSKNYCHWTEAILASSYPLRRQWLKTAELSLQSDPDNRQIRRIMLIGKMFCDPRPFTGMFKWIKWSTHQCFLKNYYLLRKKLRKLKTGDK